MDLSKHRGFSLPELVVGVFIAGIVGVALTKLLISQGQFFSHQDAIREARSNARASLNVLYSELRMVEAEGGVVAANSSSITTRQPYVFGIVCDATASAITFSALPIDTVAYAGAAIGGYGWRNDTTGVYAYVNGASVTGGTATLCTGDSITTLNGGQVLSLSPGVAGIDVGTVVFLYRMIQYAFGPSAAIPGTTALWRTDIMAGLAEELVAPFQSDARFRFFVGNAHSSQSAPPASLSDLLGVEIMLNGRSALPASGQSAPQEFDFSASVFFHNRQN